MSPSLAHVRLAPIVLLLVVASCGGAGTGDPGAPGAPSSATGAAGGGSAPALVDGGPASTEPLDVVPLLLVAPTGPVQPIDDGDTLSLRLPPQGGFVLWVTAKARGVTSPQLEVRYRLRSLATGLIVAEEGRTPEVAPLPDEPGWSMPAPLDFRNINHVPVCPNYGDEPLLEVAMLLEVLVAERDGEGGPAGRKGQASRTVTLSCGPDSFSCTCECSVGYALGGCGEGAEP